MIHQIQRSDPPKYNNNFMKLDQLLDKTRRLYHLNDPPRRSTPPRRLYLPRFLDFAYKKKLFVFPIQHGYFMFRIIALLYIASHDFFLERYKYK